MIRSLPLPTALAAAALASCAPSDDGAPPCRDVACAVRGTRDVGALPNDLAVGRCGAGPVVFATASGDGAIDALVLDPADAAPPRLSFPVVDDRGAGPWDLALAADGARGAATLQGQDAVVWLAPCEGTVLDVATLGGPDALVVDVDPPLRLDAPRDVDGDGAADATVARMIPSAPQGVAVVGDRVFVSFTSVIEPSLRAGDAPAVGPGVVVAFDVVDDALVRAGHVVLPWRNPGSLTVDDDGGVWASCAGAFSYADDDGALVAGPGGLVRLDAETLDVDRTIPFEDFAPGTPAIVDGRVVVGSLLRPQLVVLPPDATTAAHGTLVAFAGDALDAVFSVVPYGPGRVLAPQFGRDLVHVVDVETADVVARVPVGAAPAIEGAQAVVVVDPPSADGVDVVVLLGLAARAALVSLSPVLAP